MYLAEVIGTVVATKKAEGLSAQRLLLVQPLDGSKAPTGAAHVAVDVVSAGEGDLVSCVGSREAALACDPTFVPVDAAIIGIVDHADIVAGPKKARKPAKKKAPANAKPAPRHEDAAPTEVSE